MTKNRIVKRAMRLARKPCPVCGDVWREITFRISAAGKERKIATVCFVNRHKVGGKHMLLADPQLPLNWEAQGVAA